MSETTNLKLFKHNNPSTNENQFDVESALNDNWDKIDDFAGDVNDKVIEIEDNIDGQALDIEQLQQEQQTQNTNIEGLQENDIEQDLLISKLQEDNQKFKNALLNAETEEAKSLHVEDANRFGSLEVLGNQEQETSTQGKNYFTGNKIASGTAVGVTYSFDNSILKANGTTTASGNIILDVPTGVRLPAGTYTYTIKVASGNYQRPLNTDFAFYLRSANDYITGDLGTSGITGSSINNNIHSKTFTTTEEIEIYLRIFVNASGIVFNNLELEIQIESGSEYTEFEQFVPDKPSPGYPSEVVCLGSNKNLLNLQELEVSNNNGIDTYTIDNSNQITLKNKTTTSGTPYSYSFQAFELNLPAGNYNLSAKVETNSSNYRIIIRGKKDGSNTTSAEVVSQSKDNGNFNIDYSQCDEYTIEFYANQANVEKLVTTKYYDIKIEEGDRATSYSPYRTR